VAVQEASLLRMTLAVTPQPPAPEKTSDEKQLISTSRTLLIVWRAEAREGQRCWMFCSKTCLLSKLKALEPSTNKAASVLDELNN